MGKQTNRLNQHPALLPGRISTRRSFQDDNKKLVYLESGNLSLIGIRNSYKIKKPPVIRGLFKEYYRK
jgi:hypothetical protein